MKAKDMTDRQVVDEMQKDSQRNMARRAFSSARGRIDQAQRQRTPLSPVDMRRMEFEAVEQIAAAFGVEIKDE